MLEKSKDTILSVKLMGKDTRKMMGRLASKSRVIKHHIVAIFPTPRYIGELKMYKVAIIMKIVHNFSKNL